MFHLNVHLTVFNLSTDAIVKTMIRDSFIYLRMKEIGATLGWFSNRMQGTSVDDSVRKSNNWLDQ